MTSPRQVLSNTLEQILSTDLNRIGALAGKASMDALLFAAAADLITTPRDVVLRGLDATPGAGLTLDISPGSLARFDAGAGADASQYQLGRIDTTTNFDITVGGTINPDAVNPRVYLVHGTPTLVTSDSTIRNVLTLPSRVVSPTAVDKTQAPSLTLGVTATAAAATIVALPAAPAGAVPLWYVFVPALAAALTDAELADGRVQFNPAAVVDAHVRKFGFMVSTGTGGLGVLRVGSGEAYVDGAHIKNDVAVEFTGTDVFELPAGIIASDTEHQVYIVGRGSRSPVGKTVPENYIPVIVAGNAPTESGEPGVALTYRPWRGIHDEVQITAVKPLYVGAMLSVTAGSFQEFSGYPMTKGGTRPMLWVRGADKGLPAISGTCFGKVPTITWVDPDNVTVGPGAFILGGAPVSLSSQTLNMPVNLIAGDVEAVSTFYYIYARTRLSRSTLTNSLSINGVYVMSSTAPDATGGLPTPEAGWSSFEYCFVGSFFNNSTNDIHPFTRIGNRVVWDEKISILGATPVTVAKTTVSAIMPTTATLAIAEVRGQILISDGAAGEFSTRASFGVYAKAGLATSLATFAVLAHIQGSGTGGAEDSDEARGVVVLDVPVDGADNFEVALTAAKSNPNGLPGTESIDMIVDQLGYVEAV